MGMMVRHMNYTQSGTRYHRTYVHASLRSSEVDVLVVRVPRPHDRFQEFLMVRVVNVSVALIHRRQTLVPAFLGTCLA